ncbi:MAG TPA: PhzF family phenazine biosynthesis protein [Aquella sp.]|nr:PhzF family phenazine biosynthesis protein [Aquella sp.]
MKIYKLRCFGTSRNTGSGAFVIENDGFTSEERLEFANKQKISAAIFVEEQDDRIILDYYYPHSRSPLCLHGTLAAGYVLFNKYPEKIKIIITTSIHKQKIAIIKSDKNISLIVEQQTITAMPVIDNNLLHSLLNINTSCLIRVPGIFSVGSPKLLIEVDSLMTLNSIIPNLELINKWSKENFVSGCYVYCKLNDNNYVGRNFNHLDPTLEDPATGVAAGALTAYLKHDIKLYQGANINNPCVIHTEFKQDMIFIGGTVTPFWTRESSLNIQNGY